MRRVAALVGLIAWLLPAAHVRAESTHLIVHEWGTFTSFQDSRGITIGGVNVDDEPVPQFVHRLSEAPIFTTRSTPALWSQGAPRCHPDVTLRLETPVLYFYPQPGFSSRQKIDVRATFVGGWLTEFYPFASAEYSSFPGVLDHSARGSLQWKGLQLSTAAKNLPQTAQRVWLAPRAVRSAVVKEGARQEAEKYLFYRGVGHIDAPLIVRAQEGFLRVSLRDSSLKELPPLWVVRVQPDGRVHYDLVLAGGQRVANVAISTADETSASELDALRDELATALQKEGLFDDEARAMLATWQLSYFESEGVRLFFVLPRSWTDAQLPLSISVPADITRVMLGRVELVSPHQRQALRRLYELPATAFALPPLYAESVAVQRNMQAGTVSHADLYLSAGREVPEVLQLYDSLGRFRDALLVHEASSTHDETRRLRVHRIMQLFSACIPHLPAPPRLPLQPTTS